MKCRVYLIAIHRSPQISTRNQKMTK